MNTHCPRCGTMNVAAQQPCSYCGLVRDTGFLSSPSNLQRFPRASLSASGPIGTQTTKSVLPLLAPGTTLDRDHYLLLEPQSVQQWGATVIETRWHAQEVERETTIQRSVIIADVALPTSHLRQVVSQAARRAFMSSGSPMLLNTFLEQEHCFFVFGNVSGELLQHRIDQRRLLNEAEAKRCLQDLTKALVLLSLLQPPVMHGWICPAHVVQIGSQWRLLPGSILVVGEVARLAPVDVAHSLFDPSADLFSVFQTVYAGLTGQMPPPVRSQRLPQIAPPVSPPFAAILARGLQSGFHTPTELLAAIGEPSHATNQRPHPRFSGGLIPAPQTASFPAETPSAYPTASAFSAANDIASSSTFPHPDFEDTEMPVPFLGGLPPLPTGHDGLQAWWWGVGIILAEAVFLALSH